MAHVQTSVLSRQANIAAGTLANSFASLPSVGNLVILQVTGYIAANFAVTSITDNQTGNTWARAVQGPTAGGARGEIWWCKVVGSTGTFTATVNAAVNSTIVFNMSEYSGIINPVVGRTQTNTQAATAAPNSGTTAITLDANEILVALTTPDTGNIYTYSARNVAGSNPASGWTARLTETDANTYQAVDCVHVISTVTGAMVHIWTVTPTTSGWVSCIATFRESQYVSSVPWGIHGQQQLMNIVGR